MKAGKTFAASINPREARAAVVKHLRRLNSAVNITQFSAQLYEQEMVETLVEMVRNEATAPSLRRQCAIDVLTFARGAVRPWVHMGETVNPQAEGTSGLNATVGEEIEAAKNTARLHAQLDLYIAQNKPPSEWPEDVRTIAGEMLTYYDTEDGIIDVKATKG